MSSLRLRGAAVVVAVAATGLLVTGSRATGTAPRGPSSPGVPAKPTAVATGTPSPHVLPFAQQQPAIRRAPRKTRPSKVVLHEGFDGCDHAYGNRNQCVPWRFPNGVRSGCDWLKAHGFGAVTVHGRDRHRLDANRDGVACGPTDIQSR